MKFCFFNVLPNLLIVPSVIFILAFSASLAAICEAFKKTLAFTLSQGSNRVKSNSSSGLYS
ncbi:MAG: hypothetical protein ACI9XR_001523 [Flavobacterium sp.]|jgi:hypothetical protein